MHSINFFGKAKFWKKLKSNILHSLLFLKSYLFRAATFSKGATFYSSYLFTTYFFKRLIISQLRFLSTVIKWAQYQLLELKWGSSFLCIYYCSKSHHRQLFGCTKICRNATFGWSYFLSKLLFQSLYFLRTLFLSKYFYLFTRAAIPEDAAF